MTPAERDRLRATLQQAGFNKAEIRRMLASVRQLERKPARRVRAKRRPLQPPSS
jgi:hypothetical protein